MLITDNARAEVLIQALPYIKRWMGKTIVVKYGGNAMLNEGLKAAVMEDLTLMSLVGIRSVLVHGGGPEIDGLLKRLGKEAVFVKGLRYTDEETMEVVQMVLAGKVNKDIVGLLVRGGANAVGLCGIDEGLLRARRLSAELGLVGEISSVNTAPMERALSGGSIPVIATVALGEDGDMAVYNVNADTAAAKIAIALRAEKLVLLTDVPGILRDMNDSSTLIKELDRSELPSLLAEGVVSKGMIPKTECCVAALKGGVAKTHIIDGREPHALLVELFSDQGIGTMIY